MNQDRTISTLIDQLTSDIGLTLKNARECDTTTRDEHIAKARNITLILNAVEEIDYAINRLMLDIKNGGRSPMSNV